MSNNFTNCVREHTQRTQYNIYKINLSWERLGFSQGFITSNIFSQEKKSKTKIVKTQLRRISEKHTFVYDYGVEKSQSER